MRSKYSEKCESSMSFKNDRNQWELEGGEDDYSHRKKKSGKRFHREKTMKEKYWERLLDSNE